MLKDFNAGLPIPKGKGRGPTIARNLNRMSVYHKIKEKRTLTRALLARELNLNKNTVGTLVDEWITKGFVRETEQIQMHQSGRKATTLAFVPDNRWAIGMHWNGSVLSTVVTDLYANAQLKLSANFAETSPAELVSAVYSVWREVSANRDETTCIGLTLGIPGLLDEDRRTLVRSSHLAWRNVPLWSMLRSAIPVAVALDQGVKLASLGEMHCGQGANHSHLVYCHFGQGIGSGILVNGQIIRGESLVAGELGHMIVEPEGALCACGRRGCLETIAGLKAVSARLNLLGGPVENKAADKPVGNLIDGAVDEQEWRRMGIAIGKALGSVVSMLNPGGIVCDGPLMMYADRLFPFIRQEIDAICLPEAASRVTLYRSELYPYTGSLGAAVSAIQAWEAHLELVEEPT